MHRSVSVLLSSAAAIALAAPGGALAKGGTGGGGGGGTTAADVGAIRQVGALATCSDGYTFSVSFRKGFDKRVEMQLTFFNQPAGYWSFALRNTTADLPMGGFSSAQTAAPSRQVTTLTRTVPKGASTLELSVQRRAIDPLTQTSALGPVLETCTATATVVG